MAGTKITDFPTATVPLTGTEIFPVVQGGVTKQTTINQTTANSARILANIAALQALNVATTSLPVQVQLTSNYVAGDGGGIFRYDSTDTTTADNGGTVIVDAAGRRWKRQYDGMISVFWFGARGDGVTNDTAALQAAINFAQTIKAWLFFPAVTLGYLTTGLTIGQTGTDYTCHFQGGGFDPSGASESLTGQYTGQSLLKLIAGNNQNLVTINRDAAQPMFRNMTLVGNKSQQTGISYCVYMADVASPGSQYTNACWIENCFILDGRTGGLFIGANRGSGYYSNVWFQFCGTTTSDIAVNVRCFDQQFNAIQVGSNAGIGMYIGGGTQIQIEQSVFFQNHVNLEISADAGMVQVVNSVFDDASQHGTIITRGTGVGGYGARIFTACAWQRSSASANNTYSDILVNGDQRLILNAPAFVGNFGVGALPQYNINCDNSLQTCRIRVTTPMLESSAGATAATAFTNQWPSIVYAGNRTAYLSPWAGSTQLSTIISDVEKTRVNASAFSLVGAAYCDPKYITPSPVSGGTVTMSASQTNCALLLAGNLATLTIALPPPQGDGQIVRISTSHDVTTLTVTAQSPATFVFNSSASLTAGGALAFLYVQGGTAWVRI